MGRLTLNMLLSFAQFEREVTAERIRDKIAASKRKGLWMGGNVPFGYQADGRTLKINDAEADTIKALYNLYVELGSVREVKEETSLRGLRTRVRQRSDGRVTGGTPFGRGHLYHILSNPIYAGRIRHKREVFEGRHPAIIEPEIWEHVQDRLSNEASRSRGSTKGASTSLLAGKMFDETGDRLTPSHTKKNGRRLRYYISQRLVTGTRAEHLDAWRLPAEQLEALLAKVISGELAQPDLVMRLIKDVVATEIPSIVERLSSQSNPLASIALIERIDLEQGKLTARLNADRIAARIDTSSSRINEEALHFTSTFQTRRRGVELKLQLGNEPSNPDRVLVQNILVAQRWLGMIIDGTTFTEIAEAEGTSKRRVQDLVDLAMLEPSVIDQIARGDQPSGLTTDYLIRSGVPALWTDQQERFALL
jgi:site-specific DNA recombinase